MDADVWIENIPFSETRGYVQRILWHSLLFTWLRNGGEPQRTSSWLAPVRPVRAAQENRVAEASRASAGDSKPHRSHLAHAKTR
jgi:soluble lytic murein transglycosylase